ncbi:MAG: 4Fe-4S binding protein [Eggerthellaceae bacterium]|nr:4Fe-4S binding protein [Eggerthellaceae bacterium]
MGSFKLGGMTLGSLFKKPETVCYPAEVKPAPKGLKGHVVVDADHCILCGICQKTCPCHTITVDKKARTWGINPFMCVQCGACVRACPKHCLAMDPAYTPVATAQSCTVVEVPDPKAEAAAE